MAKVTKQLEVGKRKKVRSQGQRVHFVLIASHPVKVELKKLIYQRHRRSPGATNLPPNNKGADEAQHDRR